MLNMFSIVAPIFILIALGFALVRFNILPREMIPGLGRLVLYVTLPVMIFTALARTEISAIVQPIFLLAYGLGSVGILAAVYLVTAKRRDKGAVPSGIMAIGVAIPNSIFIGYPVLLQVMPETAGVALAMVLLVENLVTLPLAIVLIEFSEGAKTPGKGMLGVWGQAFGRVFRNPVIISIAAGIFASLIGLKIPGALNQSLALLAEASVTIALIYIGGSLAGAALRERRTEVGVVAVGKLVMHPLLVWLMIGILPDFDPVLQTAAVLLAAIPMMTIYPVIGGSYGYREFCSGALLATTAASFLTIPLVLTLIGPLPG